jgi:hypothetical protein
MSDQVIAQERISKIRTLNGVRHKMFIVGLPVGFLLLAASVCMYVFSPENAMGSQFLVAALIVLVVMDIVYWTLGSVIDVKRENFMKEFVGFSR